MFHLIRAGVAGGKTVPESVAENPLVFATLTAPSFGPVHGRRDGGRRCHPRAGTEPPVRARPARGPAWRRHGEDDPLLGQPMCGDCYDYASHVVWQWWAPDLWRRFTIALRRLVAKTLGVPASRLAEVATVQYAKVAEYQLRGVVHFHALVRLDGPRTPDGFAPAPAAIDAARLADLVRAGRRLGAADRPRRRRRRPARVLAFGRQLDARPVRTSRRTDDPDRALSPGAGRRLPGQVRHQVRHRHRRHRQRPPPPAPRHRTRPGRPRRSRQPQDRRTPYELLGKWAHMLGFRGHFASKSRRYSITLGALRRARRRAQALIAAVTRRRPPARPGRPRGRPPGRRRHRDHPRHRPLALRRHRLGHRSRTRPRHRRRRPSPRVRPVRRRSNAGRHKQDTRRRSKVMRKEKHRGRAQSGCPKMLNSTQVAKALGREPVDAEPMARPGRRAAGLLARQVVPALPRGRRPGVARTERGDERAQDRRAAGGAAS